MSLEHHDYIESDEAEYGDPAPVDAVVITRLAREHRLILASYIASKCGMADTEADLADYTGFPIPNVVKRHEAVVSSHEELYASIRSGAADFAPRGYVALEDDDEPLDEAWVFANFQSMGPQYSARRRSDCQFLVWENRFERFTLWNNPVTRLKTRGDVRMLLFVLAGITDLTKKANGGG